MIIIIIPVKQASYCLLMLKLQTLQISFCQAACVHAFTCGVCWLMCKRVQVTLYQALLCESCGLCLIIYLQVLGHRDRFSCRHMVWTGIANDSTMLWGPPVSVPYIKCFYLLAWKLLEGWAQPSAQNKRRQEKGADRDCYVPSFLLKARRVVFKICG